MSLCSGSLFHAPPMAKRRCHKLQSNYSYRGWMITTGWLRRMYARRRESRCRVIGNKRLHKRHVTSSLTIFEKLVRCISNVMVSRTQQNSADVLFPVKRLSIYRIRYACSLRSFYHPMGTLNSNPTSSVRVTPITIKYPLIFQTPSRLQPPGPSRH